MSKGRVRGLFDSNHRALSRLLNIPSPAKVGEKKMSKNIRMFGKSIPLLTAIVAGMVLTGGAMAVLNLFWRSANIASTYQFTVSGLSGEALQCVNGDPSAFIANYEGSVVASTLGPGTFSQGDGTFTKSFALVYLDGNTPLTSGLVIDLDVNVTGPGSSDVTWEAEGRYCIIYYNDGAGENQFLLTRDPVAGVLAPVSFIAGEYTVAEADIGLMTYDETLIIDGTGETLKDGNMMLIELTFSGGGDGLSWGDHTVDISVSASLGTDT